MAKPKPLRPGAVGRQRAGAEAALKADPRWSDRAIAEEVGVSQHAVWNARKRLKAQRVIQRVPPLSTQARTDKNNIQIALSVGRPSERSGGLTSPVKPNSRFSISSAGMASCAAIWAFVMPSFQSSVNIICQTLERSGGRPLGSSVPYF